MIGSYDVGVVEHEGPAHQLSEHVPGPLEESHVATHVGHHGGDNGGESLHGGELLDATGEGESPVADTGDVEVVSQSEAALVEHEVHDGDVELLLCQPGLVVRQEN